MYFYSMNIFMHDVTRITKVMHVCALQNILIWNNITKIFYYCNMEVAVRRAPIQSWIIIFWQYSTKSFSVKKIYIVKHRVKITILLFFLSSYNCKIEKCHFHMAKEAGGESRENNNRQSIICTNQHQARQIWKKKISANILWVAFFTAGVLLHRTLSILRPKSYILTYSNSLFFLQFIK